jgi:hypothetical protein
MSSAEGGISYPYMSHIAVWLSLSSSYASPLILTFPAFIWLVVPGNSPPRWSRHALRSLVFHKQDLPRRALPPPPLAPLPRGVTLHHRRHVFQSRSPHCAQHRVGISRPRAHDHLLCYHVVFCLCSSFLSDAKGIPIPKGRSAFRVRHGRRASFYSRK